MALTLYWSFSVFTLLIQGSFYRYCLHCLRFKTLQMLFYSVVFVLLCSCTVLNIIYAFCVLVHITFFAMTIKQIT